jgi:phosphate transport system permease protein
VPTIDKTLIRRAKRRDKIARWMITLGGAVVIVSVAAILLLIVSITFPLFLPPRAENRVTTALPENLTEKDILALGVDLVELGKRTEDDSLTGYMLDRNGVFTFLDFAAISPFHLGEGSSVRVSKREGVAPAEMLEKSTSRSATAARQEPRPPKITVFGREQATAPSGAKNQTLLSVERHAGSEYTLLWSDGSISLVAAELNPQFDELGRRNVKHNLRTRTSLSPDGKEIPLQAIARKSESDAITCVKLLPKNRLSVLRKYQYKDPNAGLLDEPETVTNQLMIEEGLPGTITALTLDSSGKTLYAGTANGCLAQWDFGDDGKIVYHDVIPAFRDKRAITSLALMLGEISLAVGDEHGEMTIWTEIREDSSDGGHATRKLKLIHELSRHDGPVCDIIPSRRDKSLVSLGKEGTACLDFMTSGRALLNIASEEPITRFGYSPRGNALVGLTRQGTLKVWKIDCPHPEISWGALFGKIHYEGYAEPAYKWQTTGDEPKYSLVPIIFGTLKSTVYAMIFALPLSLAGAIYVSYFTTPGFKKAIKPVVEIMAAVPSVVIGFLILLWLAPLMGKWLLAVFACFLTIPAMFLVFMACWQAVRKYDWAKRVEHGYEFLVLVPVILTGAGLACALSGPIEIAFFHGDIRQWLFDTLHQRYDALNSLVVAFGLGFAVIPIIFSISEDALSNIPFNLTAASLALGASRWQTLWRVILPSASPGIFAAVMIGFGRAVGETMIVFMAGGNVPILDPSPFNGFRTLSANIAVEMPEAAVNGTLFRILFLCAVLLFILTFLLNTVAEVVRQHLRKKYGRY